MKNANWIRRTLVNVVQFAMVGVALIVWTAIAAAAALFPFTAFLLFGWLTSFLIIATP